MIERLACKLGRNDETPNIELAEYLCQRDDASGIEEIAGGLKSGDKAVANDCIKVLYEIGARNPRLIRDYADDFIAGLRSNNNRIVWGSMMALAGIAEYAAPAIFKQLDAIVAAYEKGSVITVDNSVSVFAGLCKANGSYAQTVLPIILNHLQKCRPKEVAQHAERASVCFNAKNADSFMGVLKKREPDLTAAQQSRINKLLKKLNDLTK